MALTREEILASKSAHIRPAQKVLFAEESKFIVYLEDEPTSNSEQVESILVKIQGALSDTMWIQELKRITQLANRRSLDTEAAIEIYKEKIGKRFQAMRLIASSQAPGHGRGAKRRAMVQYEQAMDLLREINIDGPEFAKKMLINCTKGKKRR
mmetsp:Transcript_8145/g.10647  ORF Transcript_8145/g.10647 Transcript_8145/m.10647 type:complete len:153 (+) Transcript_8145:140-598(+)